MLTFQKKKTINNSMIKKRAIIVEGKNALIALNCQAITNKHFEIEKKKRRKNGPKRIEIIPKTYLEIVFIISMT